MMVGPLSNKTASSSHLEGGLDERKIEIIVHKAELRKVAIIYYCHQGQTTRNDDLEVACVWLTKRKLQLISLLLIDLNFY